MDEKQNRTELRNRLKQGDITKISTMSGCSRKTVYCWFAGENDNLNISEAVADMLEEREKADLRIKALIKT
jgi:hypothetical protein